jgi:hypothetical protein
MFRFGRQRVFLDQHYGHYRQPGVQTQIASTGKEQACRSPGRQYALYQEDVDQSALLIGEAGLTTPKGESKLC